MPAPGQLVVQPWEHDALRHYEAGETMPQIADELGVKASTLGSCFARWKRLGALSGSRREQAAMISALTDA